MSWSAALDGSRARSDAPRAIDEEAAFRPLEPQRVSVLAIAASPARGQPAALQDSTLKRPDQPRPR